MFNAGKPASRRILVVRLGAMGDIIHALPAVAWLKQSHPGSHLTWLVEPRWAPLLEENPYVDRVVLLHRQNFAGLVETRRELRTAHYDFAVDFQGLLKSAMAASAASPDRLYGFHQSQVRERLAALFYSHKTVSRAAHVVDRNLELAAACSDGGMQPRQAPFSAAGGPRRRRSAAGRLRARLSAGRMGFQAVADGPLPAHLPRACATNSASRWCSTVRRARTSPRPRPRCRTIRAWPD